MSFLHAGNKLFYVSTASDKLKIIADIWQTPIELGNR